MFDLQLLIFGFGLPSMQTSTLLATVHPFTGPHEGFTPLAPPAIESAARELFEFPVRTCQDAFSSYRSPLSFPPLTRSVSPCHDYKSAGHYDARDTATTST